MIGQTENHRERWERITARFLASRGWDPAGSSLLLAVSGGADSIALFHWARRLAAATGGKLAVAHVDHGLRPSAAEDHAFVSALCRDAGIPLFERRLDPEGRPARESVEMWGRRERYAFFEAAARQSGCDWILTAHHRDDLVETVFQRLGRGTGFRGLGGIPFRRGAIIRPFLDRSRAEILAYLALCGASWREDESNADARIDRNWYRHRYLPALRREDPDLDARVFAMALRAQELSAGVEAMEAEEGLLAGDAEGRPYLAAAGIARAVEEGNEDALAFWIRKLVRASAFAAASTPSGNSAPAAGEALETEARPAPVTKEILLEFRRQWATRLTRLQVPLTALIALKCENGRIYCVTTVPGASRRRRLAKKNCSPEAQRVILIQGFCAVSWRWGDLVYSLAARRYPRPESLEYPGPRAERAIFDADRFSCTLLVRTRKDGDRFSPLGLSSRSRKLKSFFNEEKVPIGKREIIPIVLAGEPPKGGSPGSPEVGAQRDESSGGACVAWVPGLGISDFFKVSGSTSHILELVLKCENP